VIIVGIDYSEGSAAAVKVARALAGLGVPVRPVHVCGSSRVEGPTSGAEAWLEALGFEPGDVEERTGVPWVELVRSAQEHGASLLIAGTHGDSGFQPFKLGGTAELVALRSRTPVVLVPFRSSLPDDRNAGINPQGLKEIAR
jgi:nucleotide-binding universal stress UspA family protein